MNDIAGKRDNLLIDCDICDRYEKKWMKRNG